MNLSYRQADYEHYVAKTESNIVLKFSTLDMKTTSLMEGVHELMLERPESWDKFILKDELDTALRGYEWAPRGPFPADSQAGQAWLYKWDVGDMSPADSSFRFQIMLERISTIPGLETEMLDVNMERWMKPAVNFVYSMRVRAV